MVFKSNTFNAVMVRCFSSIILLFFYLSFSYGQTYEVEFGKNRVQYHGEFDYWNEYETQNFITFYYSKGKNIARIALQIAENDLNDLQSLFEYRINSKITMIVYTDITDLKQSNIGLEELFLPNLNETKVLDNKIFIYFDGNHRHLRSQIREGIARIYISHMMTGGNLQEYVQNALSSDLPEWYLEGLIEYAAEGFTIERKDLLRDIIPEIGNKDFYELAAEHPEIFGIVFWHYMNEEFGHASISNLLYMTRIRRDLESSFKYVINQSLDSYTQEVLEYIHSYGSPAEGAVSFKPENRIKTRNPRNAIFTLLEVSPQQDYLAYATNEKGLYHLYVQDLTKGKRRKIIKGGLRNPFQEVDKQYPLATWHPDENLLAVIYEKNDEIFLLLYNPADDTKEIQLMPSKIQRVFGMDVVDENTLLLSANSNGYSDLYLYNIIRRRADEVTFDTYDDLYPIVADYQGKRGVIWSSNRYDAAFPSSPLEDTVLPLGAFDLYFLAFNDTASPVQLTFTPYLDEVKARQEGQDYYTMRNISGKKGVAIYNDSFEIVKAIELPRNIQEYDISGGMIFYYTKYLENNNIHAIPVSAVASKRWLDTLVVEKVKDVLQEKKDTIPDSILFQTEWKNPSWEIMPATGGTLTNVKRIEEGALHTDDEKALIVPDPHGLMPFYSTQALAYRRRFTFEDFTTTMDNSILISGLNTFAASDDPYKQRDVGILIKTTIKDVLEDYIFEGGVRLQTNFRGAEYFLTFENRKRRWDKRFSIYRKTDYDERIMDFSFFRFKNIQHVGIAEWIYPFDIYRSIRLAGILRLDRSVVQATDNTTLEVEDFFYQRLGARAAYVFDNTYQLGLNRPVGTRYRLQVESFKRFDLEFSPFEFNAHDGFMSVISLDARHYIRLLKKSVLAGRLAAGTSLGSERILYALGGPDNWLFASSPHNTPAPALENLAYQAPVTSLRGFKNNIRNGTGYTVINLEMRVPLFQYFSKKKIRSGFFRNFLLVPFFDIGSTWTGENPFDDDTPFNTIVVNTPPSNPVIAEINYFREPIVYGYGAGIRSTLLGFYLRLDYGTGVDSGVQQDSRITLSMGYDF